MSTPGRGRRVPPPPPAPVPPAQAARIRRARRIYRAVFNQRVISMLSSLFFMLGVVFLVLRAAWPGVICLLLGMLIAVGAMFVRR